MTQKSSLDAATLARWRQDIVFKDNVLGDDYTFHSTWGIFSPESIDEGSRLLLEHVDFKATEGTTVFVIEYIQIGVFLMNRRVTR